MKKKTALFIAAITFTLIIAITGYANDDSLSGENELQQTKITYDTVDGSSDLDDNTANYGGDFNYGGFNGPSCH